MNKINTRKLTLIALFTALVFIFSAFFQIPISTPFGQTRFHLGNALCLMAGILMTPLYGGLASGLGSVIFDLTNPIYFASAPFTFINKFMMGFVAGLVYHRSKEKNKKLMALAGILGQLTYIVLYLIYSFIKSRYFMDLSLQATMTEVIQKGSVSLFNGLISVIFAVILGSILKDRIKF
ncbi:MAG: ECF transporter S component [Peptoniphilaceae bacterium]|nr:ECF transporter S component [Peptoniphilaceae bacterium]MDY6018833.1 ECF transporter S component [Anaerococcus sp.]